MKKVEYDSFRNHAENRTLRFEGHQFCAGQKQLIIYRVRRSGHGIQGTAEAEVHIHLAQIGNGVITGVNIRWTNDKPTDALELGTNGTISRYCTDYYFPDQNRRNQTN